MIELQPDHERHIVIGVTPPHYLGPGEEPLEELASLVDAAGAKVVGQLHQKRRRPHPKTYLGKGKLEELKQLVEEHKPHTVTADDDLSPTQLETLEAEVCTKVIDRSEVILDIFATRARTHQAQLQVLLAQMQYELPRLGRLWTHLERLGGGIGTRGPGETQIETDRRLLRLRIKSLRRELAEIERRKAQEVSARAEEFTVSLVGYTNAGKSTLMNALCGADAYVENKLFATLDTLTRPLDLGGGVEVLLSDTVGFIRRLPHHLVASFHATLEEAVQAKLLLHVVDAGSPLAVEHIRAVNETLSDVGCKGREHIYVFNKVDCVPDRVCLNILMERYTPSVAISAHTGEGLDELREHICRLASTHSVRQLVRLRFAAGDGRRFAAVNEVGRVRDTCYEDSSVIVDVELAAADVERLRKLPGEMTVED